MLRTIAYWMLAISVGTLVGTTVWGQAAPEVTLTRIECGSTRETAVNERFSDTYSLGDLKVAFVFSCYLIKHGSDYMLWDTGHALTAPGGVAPKVSVVDQLKQLNVTPDQIKYVGISHYHGDHTGQLDSFPGAHLMIGSGDWNAVSNPKPSPGVNSKPFAHWISGGGKVEPLPGDKDVFNDGTVIILSTPGHTPGHRSVMVKLQGKGSVILVGDAVHFRENYESNGVPTFNVSRADSVASMDRIKKLASVHRATVIIQHDARDVSKLPAFPAAAR